ncbi:hypothetical protein PoB_006260700 [Plakobranchus ocellatus]|uniref:Uncharacterized protein n=1 Tax=Plakobranchus ocellatus TaxID=259542 RepID=A0AAV4CW10_9GAST|nr:hypothetical protein PoB_006260700 [Plakobranchus ocellatus]
MIQPRLRVSINDTNNNSIDSSKDSPGHGTPNSTITLVPPASLAQTVRGQTSSCDVTRGQTNADRGSSKTSGPSDKRVRSPGLSRDKDSLADTRSSSSPSPPFSSFSSSPPFSPESENLLDKGSPGSRHSQSPSLDPPDEGSPKSGLSFSIDRILSITPSCSNNRNSSLASTSRHGSMNKKPVKTGRATSLSATDRSSSPGATRAANQEKLSRSRHGSRSDEVDDCPDTPRTADVSPAVEVEENDLEESRRQKDPAPRSISDQARSRLASPSTSGSGCVRASPLNNFCVLPTATGQLIRPGHPDLVVVNDLSRHSGHAGHPASGLHNTYHSPGLFLPPPDICRLEPHR